MTEHAEKHCAVTMCERKTLLLCCLNSHYLCSDCGVNIKDEKCPLCRETLLFAALLKSFRRKYSKLKMSNRKIIGCYEQTKTLANSLLEFLNSDSVQNKLDMSDQYTYIAAHDSSDDDE